MNRHQRRAAAPRTDDAGHLNDRGIALAKAGRLAEATACLQAAIRIRPAYAGAYNNLGIVLARQDRPGEAAAAFGAALLHAPLLAEAHKNLGNVLAMQQRPEEAIACYRRSVALRPDDPETHNNLGITLTEQGRLGEAVEAFGQALRLRPAYADASNNLGIAALYAGDLEGARVATERALNDAPAGPAYLNLANLKRFTADDPHLAAMESLAAQGSAIPENSRAAVHFALGKAYDDCGQPERAFAHLLAGNALTRKSAGYDESAALGAMAQIEQVFDAAMMQALAAQHDASGSDADTAPIFILGMPRSGSTLIEQMLASHDSVYGAGERGDFSRLAKAMAAPAAYPEGVASVAPKTLRELGRAYLRALQGEAPRGKRITDKMPGNFLYAGLIHLALPRAKIIHTRRNPADTCLSCFSKMFRTGHGYSFDLGELGRYYRAYEGLMAHWRSVLPKTAMIEVMYEAVVADPEAEMRRILEFCGLPWSDRCLDFTRTGRAVLTASATQVRGRINDASVGRWRRYEAMLGPLLKEIDAGTKEELCSEKV